MPDGAMKDTGKLSSSSRSGSGFLKDIPQNLPDYCMKTTLPAPQPVISSDPMTDRQANWAHLDTFRSSVYLDLSQTEGEMRISEII